MPGIQPTGQTGGDRFGPFLAGQRRRPADDVEAGGVVGARSHHRDQQVGKLGMGAMQDHPARQPAIGHLLPDHLGARDDAHRHVGRKLCRVGGRSHDCWRGAGHPDREMSLRRIVTEGEPQDGGQHERCDEARDQDGAVPHPPAQFVCRDDPDQSRSSFPVSARNTPSRSGATTSTPESSTPSCPASRTTLGNTAAPWSVVSSSPPAIGRRSRTPGRRRHAATRTVGRRLAEGEPEPVLPPVPADQA